MPLDLRWTGENLLSEKQLRPHWQRWSVLCVLLVLCLMLLVELGGEVMAQTTAGSGRGGNGEVFVVAGQVTNGTYGLFLVDTKNETICVYQYLPQTRKLKLMAARTYRFDTKLDDYNSDGPSPEEVKKLVSQQKPLGR